MCTLRQTGLRSQPSGGGAHQQWQGPHGLEAGISVMAWGVQGYRLMLAESGSVAQVCSSNLVFPPVLVNSGQLLLEATPCLQ